MIQWHDIAMKMNEVQLQISPEMNFTNITVNERYIIQIHVI